MGSSPTGSTKKQMEEDDEVSFLDVERFMQVGARLSRPLLWQALLGEYVDEIIDEAYRDAERTRNGEIE